MPFRFQRMRLDKSAGPLRRALQYAFYDWTHEMPKAKRVITWIGVVFQGYAVYSLVMWTFALPKPLSAYFLALPKSWLGYFLALLIYYVGYCIMNGTLTSEFVRKTRLESEQIAAQQIQRTLQPDRVEPLPGYQVETFHQPFREVGGDYFDVIELRDNKTLFAIADVSGKGVPAALLAANIQALVRSIANSEADPLAFARGINKHLSRYTPNDRFATAAFIVLDRESGGLNYVNAGHNAPILFSSGPSIFLTATGIPLGLLSDAQYEVGTATVPPDGSLLLFTDGLTDSIPGDNPEIRLQHACADDPTKTMSNVKALVDKKAVEDDVTILVVKRTVHAA